METRARLPQVQVSQDKSVYLENFDKLSLTQSSSGYCVFFDLFFAKRRVTSFNVFGIAQIRFTIC